MNVTAIFKEKYFQDIFSQKYPMNISDEGDQRNGYSSNIPDG